MDEIRYCTKQVSRGSYGSSRKCGKVAKYIVTTQSKKSGNLHKGCQRCEEHKTSGTRGKKVVSFEPIDTLEGDAK